MSAVVVYVHAGAGLPVELTGPAVMALLSSPTRREEVPLRTLRELETEGVLIGSGCGGGCCGFVSLTPLGERVVELLEAELVAGIS